MHSLIDKYSVAMAALLLKNGQWFRDSVNSPSYREQLDAIKLSVPESLVEGIFEVEAETIVGKLDPAFHVAKWLGSEYPTVIYHHGNNETPFNYGFASKNTFKTILYDQKDSINANLISIRAPFHNSGITHYLEKMGDLRNFTAMLSVSAKLVEALVQLLKSAGCSRVIVTGISLGGWVTNLHRSFYNSAHVYIPIFAGAALDQLFLTSYYKKLSGKLVKEQPDLVKSTLNFEKEFQQIADENVFPLMARYDQIIEFDDQKKCYGKRSIAIIDKGHITGALASKDLRKHILNHLL
jgi:hypothetical protein